MTAFSFTYHPLTSIITGPDRFSPTIGEDPVEASFLVAEMASEQRTHAFGAKDERHVIGRMFAGAPELMAAAEAFEEEFREILESEDETLCGFETADAVCRIWPLFRDALAKARDGAR